MSAVRQELQSVATDLCGEMLAALDRDPELRGVFKGRVAIQSARSLTRPPQIPDVQDDDLVVTVVLPRGTLEFLALLDVVCDASTSDLEIALIVVDQIKFVQGVA